MSLEDLIAQAKPFSIGSVLVALVAAFFHNRWSKQWEKFMDARLLAIKENADVEVAKAKSLLEVAESKIESLKDLSPEKMRAQFEAIQKTYEDRIKQLEGQIRRLESELDDRQHGIGVIKRETAGSQDLIDNLQKQNELARKEINELRHELESARAKIRDISLVMDILADAALASEIKNQAVIDYRARRVLLDMELKQASQATHRSVAAYMNARASERSKRSATAQRALHADFPPEDGNK